MKPRHLLTLAFAFVSTTALHAEDPGSNTSVEVGLAYARMQAPGGDVDMAGFAAGLNWELGKFLADLSLAADYRHLESTDGSSLTRDDFDADIRFGVPVLGILKPYISAGISVDKNEAAAYTPDNNWAFGTALGAGVGITVIPGLLHTTPSVRYVWSDKVDTVTYSLDTAFHFTLVGVGLRLDYEDNQTRDAQLGTVSLYAGLRF